MKKILFILSLVLLLAGCGQKAQDQQTQGQTNDNKSIFSSIKDAFDRSLTLRCEYTDEDGEKSINYIKNKMIRTEGTSEGKQVIGLFRDNKLYIFTPGSADGMVFNLDELKGEGTKMGDQEIHGIDDIINELESEKDKCSVQNISDSLFEVPNDVNFTDLNELLNQFNQ